MQVRFKLVSTYITFAHQLLSLPSLSSFSKVQWVCICRHLAFQFLKQKIFQSLNSLISKQNLKYESQSKFSPLLKFGFFLKMVFCSVLLEGKFQTELCLIS